MYGKESEMQAWVLLTSEGLFSPLHEAPALLLANKARIYI